MGTQKAIGQLIGLNAASAVLGLATSVLIARLFGTTPEAAVYFGATTLLAVTVSMTQTGQILEIFMPVYHQRRRVAGMEAAHAAVSVTMNWMAIGLGLLATLVAAGAPTLVRLLLPGFAPDSQLLGANVFRAIAPLLAVRSLLAMLHMVGNAERRFGVPESVALVGRLFSIGTIVLATPSLGIWALVLALWVGDVCRLVGFGLVLFQLGYRYRPILRIPGYRASAVFRQMLYTIWYAGATQVWTFALNAALSLLSEETYALYKHVETIYRRTSSLVLRPVSVVFFTLFAETAAKGLSSLWALVREATNQALVLAALTLCAGYVSARPVLELLWGGDRFTDVELSLAAKILAAMFGLMLVQGPAQVLRKASVAAGWVRPLYLGMAGVQLLSAASAGPLVVRFGVWGAIAALGVNAAGFLIVPIVLVRTHAGEWVGVQVRTVFRWAIAVGLGIGVGQGLFENSPRWGWLGDQPFAVVLIATASAGLTSLLAAFLLGDRPLSSWWPYKNG